MIAKPAEVAEISTPAKVRESIVIPAEVAPMDDK
jgi:hypothetical protein